MTLAAVMCALVLTGCGRDPVATRVSEKVGVTEFSHFDRVSAPDISGTTLDGRKLALSDFAGQVVVLNNWASWCLPCNDEAAILTAASKEFDGQGVRFIGLDVSDQTASAKEFVATYKIPYPSIIDQSGAKLGTLPGVPPQALPSTLIIDRDGSVAVRIIGVVKQPEFSRLINGVLTE
ncbi:MAG: TlpA disulfide reductase family protein [Candidatus Nanopelagicales bacterium]